MLKSIFLSGKVWYLCSAIALKSPGSLSPLARVPLGPPLAHRMAHQPMGRQGMEGVDARPWRRGCLHLKNNAEALSYLKQDGSTSHVYANDTASEYVETGEGGVQEDTGN